MSNFVSSCHIDVFRSANLIGKNDSRFRIQIRRDKAVKCAQILRYNQTTNFLSDSHVKV